MSKWKQLSEKLQGMFTDIKIKADGYEVHFIKQVDTKHQKLVIATYVNGEIRGAWTEVQDGKPVHPEARFWFPMKRAAHPRKQYNAIKRIWGKKDADKLTTPRVIGYLPHWNSPRSLVAHLKREFPDLEIVEDSSHG